MLVELRMYTGGIVLFMQVIFCSRIIIDVATLMKVVKMCKSAP